MPFMIVFLVIVALIILISGLKIVPQANVYVVERLGTFKGALSTRQHSNAC